METLRFLLTSSFYPPFHIGGDAVHVRYLAEALASRGHEVHVLHSLDAFEVKRQDAGFEARSESVFTHTIRTPLSLSAYAGYVLGGSHAVNRRFEALLHEINPDVVHHHNISLLGYSILRKRREYLNLYTAHDYWLFCQQNNLIKFGRFICTKKNCTACSFLIGRPPQVWRNTSKFDKAVHEVDCVIAPSNFMLRTLRHEVPNLNIHHIPNFVPRTDLRLLSESTRDSPYFVYMGGLERHKGIVQLLRHYANSGLRGAVKIRLIGKGSLENTIVKLIQSNEMNGEVSMLGSLPSAAAREQLHNSVALILPSIWHENAPLVVLEALSIGTPAITSNLGGLPEIVEPIDPRLIFSWQEENGLDRSLEFVLDHREALRDAVLDTYNAFFSPERYLDSYMALLSDVST